MTNNFDWQTDEDREWESDRPEGDRARPARRWALPAAIILIALVAGGAIYWQVQKRLTAAETAISDDIRSSFHLIREADEEGDIELFRNLLSGSDLEWADAQQALFAQGRLFDLTAYGLSEAPRAVTDVEVTLSPSLNSAEVSALVIYGDASGDIVSEPVRLLQTRVFRRGERWIWSPPREEFWLGKASIQERFLTVSFPMRDEALALRLARDLDLLVADLCDVAGLACPEGLMLTLDFSREPGALVAINERFVEEGLWGSRLSGRAQGRDGLTMTLPTPSLLGTPLDEASYQALLNGFGAHLAVALADRFVDADCCGTESRVRAAERHMLGDLGLDPWFGLAAGAGRGVSGLPHDHVALLCSDGFRRQQRLFLLDLSRMTWQEQAMMPELIAIKAMPNGDGILLLGQVVEEKRVRSQVWHLSAQGPTMLFDLPVTEAQAAQIGWELQEQQALLVVEVPDLHRGYSSYFSIDLAQCGHGECPMRPQSTVSRPVWSPDGSQLMVRAYGLLWWRVGASMVPIADGSVPFWVDEEHYGYVRTFGQEQAVVMVETGRERSERVVLTTSDLRDAVGLETRPRRLLIGRVIADQPGGAGPGGGEWLLLAFEIGAEGDVNQARFFAYDLDEQEARLIPHAGRLLSFNLTSSRDKIAMGGLMEEDGRWTITVVGREIPGTATVPLAAGGTAGAVPSFSWSRDESWLLILDQGLLTLCSRKAGRYRQSARLMRVACRRPGTVGAMTHKVTVPAWLGVILMANEFEWHTEVDGGWEPQAPEPRPSQRPTSRQRKLLVLAIAVSLLLAAGYGAYQILTGRVEEVTGTTERGLLMAHELLASGSLDGDQDLVMSVVAKRPTSWRDLNADLVARQLFFSRRPLGIEVIRESGQQAAEIETRLTPELDAAEIVDRRSYVAHGRGMMETVMLERSFFYELAGEQWVLSPTADERAFWGNWITDERTNITLTYPERDEDVAIRLSGYLDSLLPALCAEGLDCPDDFHLTVKLERDPTSIRRLSEGVYAVRASSGTNADRLVLPAPSLVGKPVDEAGYEALERGYASWIGTAVVVRYGPATLGPEDVLAHFDLQVPPTPVEPLPRPARGAFPAGAIEPDQDVLLLCYGGSLDRVLRFETASGTWQEEATGALWGQVASAIPGRSPSMSTYLSRLPDYRRAIVQTASGQGEQVMWQSYLLTDGSARLLTEVPQMHIHLPPRLQPDGQPPENLLSFYVPGDEPGKGFSSLLVDLNTCQSSTCATESLPGIPIWSPDGRRTALIAPGADGSQRLYLGDGRGEIVAEVDTGQSPAWVDEDRFAYVAQGHEDPQDRLARWFGQEVRLVDADSESPSDGQLLFDAETLRRAIPVEKRPDNLALWTIQPAVPGSGSWYVTARGEWQGQRMDYFLVYDQVGTAIRLAIPLGKYGLVQPPMVNAPRTQALIVALPRDGSEMSVELVSVNTGEVSRLPGRLPQDWSADGQWLIQLDRGLVTLVSTDSAAEWPIARDLDSCYWAVWTQQQEE